MEVRCERDSSGLTTIHAELDADLVAEVYRDALKRLRRHVRVPGFRPGHVPPKMVETVLGREAVIELAQDMLARRAYPAVMAELPSLVALDEPQIDADHIVPGESCPMTVRVVTAQVELGEYEGRPIEMERVEITEQEARKRLEERFREEAHYRPADHEDVRKGDWVTFALRIVRNGMLVDEYPASDPLRVLIGDNPLVPNIDDHLVGLSVGQASTFEVTYPEDFENEDLRGATAEFTVQIVAVEERESLDAFVAREEAGTSVEAAVEQEREAQARYQSSRARVDARERAVRRLVEESHIDLPRAYVESEVMDAIETYEEDMRSQGVDVTALDPEEADAYEERIRADVIYDLQRRVVLEAVARAETVEVEQQDLVQEVLAVALMNGVEPTLMLRRMEEEGMLGRLAHQARLRKAADAVLSKMAIVEVDQVPEESGTERDLVTELSTSEMSEDQAADDDDEAVAEPEDEPCP